MLGKKKDLGIEKDIKKMNRIYKREMERLDKLDKFLDETELEVDRLKVFSTNYVNKQKAKHV
ncbi:hypothetical protein [Neobacillus sp.]|uniref:hypothetical protein n=1 Tax=Neobacillus sp. TaxID=2675273 RepID=UPI0028A11A1C|nr:hypothetical protein [Neobacillus sp.]